MKKIIGFVLIFLSIVPGARAQMAFVDTKYILGRMPDYNDSVRKINGMAILWQKEIDDRQAVLDKMEVEFQRDEVMLSDSIKKIRTDAIFNFEKEVRNLQRGRFGFHGDLYNMNDSLLGPMKKRVDEAIQVVAARLQYKVVLDKSDGFTVLYFKPGLDISDEVMKEMGMK